MEIKNQESETKGEFYIEVDGKKEALMSYTKAGPGRIIVDHTEVSEVLKGKNVGKQLVTHAVEYARKNKLKILPLCPFTRSVFQRVKEYEDVWDK